jgi:hypothetical protein
LHPGAAVNCITLLRAVVRAKRSSLCHLYVETSPNRDNWHPMGRGQETFTKIRAVRSPVRSATIDARANGEVALNLVTRLAQKAQRLSVRGPLTKGLPRM